MEAARFADQAFVEFEDEAGRWRDLEVVLATSGSTRIFLGRDKSPAQVAVEIKGKRLAQRVAARMTGKDACLRRSDGVVALDRRPLARELAVGDGETEVLERGRGRELRGVEGVDLGGFGAAPPGAAGMGVVTALRLER